MINSAFRFFANRRACLAATFFFLIFPAANVSQTICPHTSLQTDAWIEQSVTSLVRTARAAYVNESAQPRYERVVNGIAGTIEGCRVANNPEFSQRYPEFFGYVRLLALATKDDHELGFEVSDKEYFAETSQYTTIPDFLLTPAFLRSVSSFETLAGAKALLREMNRARPVDSQLLFFSYVSRHLGTPDNPDSYRRLLIVVPGNAAQSIPEKWVQFGIADPGRPKTVRNVSVVAVAPRDEETANVYFKDFYRTYRRNGSITIKGRWELGEGDDPCVTCHKSGVLPIFPVAGSVSREEQVVMDAVNERFRSYGVARFDRYIDASRFGPGLGSSPGRSAFRGSFATNENRFNTGSCVACHHADGLGNLNWPMDSTLISSFVKGGQMPLDAHLSRAARRQLYDDLINDYFRANASRPGILQAWLLGSSRSDTAATESAQHLLPNEN